jgi:hypothetical protein
MKALHCILTLVVVGHAKGMLMNASKVFSQGRYVVPAFALDDNDLTMYRQYFGDSREPFAITVMGEELYILTSPEDVLIVYKETIALDFNPIIKEIMLDFGVTAQTVDKMFVPDAGEKHWMDLSHANFKLQMHPGDKLEVLQANFLGKIDRSLRWENISGPMVIGKSDGSKELTISLWEWCGHVLVDAATRAFFGDVMFRISPNVLKDFFIFDEQSWKLSYKYPHWAAADMYNAKTRGEATFIKYLALPKKQREDACWIVKELELGMEALGIEEEGQKAPLLFILYRL